jgi:class 3 adenylate cyclase/tetratricopeptide (TPR) repeat protein
MMEVGSRRPTPVRSPASLFPGGSSGEPVPEGRRRLAAIMFTDMVGFSALTQQDEPLALRLMEEQRKIVRPVIGRFAGKEVKTMGDGALVVFDSALDATECAVEFQRQLFERNRDVPGHRIEIRVGIHVGDVVHSENDVYGDAVNIAARVEPLAETGGICVTGQVREQVQNKIPYPMKVVEGAHLKNIETPVTVFRLELPWTPPSLSGLTPFTDRKEELEHLKRLVAAMRAGHGVTVAISGEAGVGKSRMADEFVSRAEKEGARVLRGRANQGIDSAPFSSWSEAVREFSREASNPLLYQACAECEPEMARLVPELRSRLGRAAEPVPGDESSESRFFEGIHRFLENLSRDAPAIVLIEDAQWLGSASLHLVDFLGRRIQDDRVLVVLVYREGHSAELGPLEGVVHGLSGERRLEQVRLHRFDAPTSVQFLLQMLRGRLPASGGDLAAPLFEKSGGNPLFLEAIVRALVSEGSLVWTDAGWAPKPGVTIRLPPGIQSIVRQRLSQLPPRTVEVLRQAAVLGSRFSFDALQRAMSIPSKELLPRLEEAIRARILEEHSAGPGRSSYGFTDLSVVETLYDEISLVRRTGYHANAARVLEALSTEGVPVAPGELAHHFLRANQKGKALEYTLLAAQEASRFYARDEALRLYTTANELLDSQPDEKRRAEILFHIGDELDFLGRHSEAYRSLRESAEIYEQLGLTLKAGAGHTDLARRISAHNEPVRAMEHLDKARRLLETGVPSPELARLYDTIGLIMFQEVRMPEAAENWLRAIDIAAKVGAPRVEAPARRMLATVVPPGENQKVWENLDSALVLAKKVESRPVISDVMMLQSIALLHIRGDGRGALRTAEDAIEYARKGHDVLYEMVLNGGIVTYIEWRLGDLSRAQQVALEHRAFVAGDPRRDRPTAIAVLAEVALARGEIERAEKLLWEGERLLAEGGDWTESAQTQIVLARCALARAKPLAALEHLRQAYALCRKAGPPAMDALFLLETLTLLVRAHLDAEEPLEAETCLRELTEFAATFGERLGEAFRSRAEGWMHAYRSELPEAIASLQASADLWKRLGWQYEWSQTMLSLAKVYQTSGDSKRAAAITDLAAEYLSKVEVPLVGRAPTSVLGV